MYLKNIPRTRQKVAKNMYFFVFKGTLCEVLDHCVAIKIKMPHNDQLFL